MDVTTSTALIDPLIMTAARGSDPRRHRRVTLKTPLHCLFPDGSEHEGALINISAGGLLVKGTAPVSVAETVTVRIPQIGHLRGRVSRMTAQGFAMAFTHTRQRAAWLADTLTWLIHGGQETGERRGADRFPQGRAAQLTPPAGPPVACEIVDISTGGAFVRTLERPPEGAEIRLGRQRAKVVRHTEEGLGVRFAPPPSEQVRPRNVSD